MPTDLLDFPWERLSVVTLLGLALLGAARRWWVVGYLYEEMKKERDLAIEKRERDNETLERLVKLLETREAAERERR